MTAIADLLNNQFKVIFAKWISGDDTSLVGAVNARGTGFSFAKVLTTVSEAVTAKDVVGGLITITGAARANGGMGVIQNLVFGGVVALQYNLWFFSADVAGAALINSEAFTLVEADEALVLGIVNIPIASYIKAESAFNVINLNNLGIYYKCGAATTSIYAYLVAEATTTPGTTKLYLNVAGEYID